MNLKICKTFFFLSLVAMTCRNVSACNVDVGELTIDLVQPLESQELIAPCQRRAQQVQSLTEQCLSQISKLKDFLSSEKNWTSLDHLKCSEVEFVESPGELVTCAFPGNKELSSEERKYLNQQAIEKIGKNNELFFAKQQRGGKFRIYLERYRKMTWEEIQTSKCKRIKSCLLEETPNMPKLRKLSEAIGC